MILHPLFHWAPRDRRDSITENGLVLGSPRTCSSEAEPYICCCMSPAQAWTLSAGIYPDRAEVWDCWQVVLASTDHVEVLPVWGNRMSEVRVRNAVSPERLFLVGERPVKLAASTVVANTDFAYRR
ncbi:MAG TPA: hypothetical protein VH084_28560 [Mycobacterium sp.]|nr:hypothetical protein [Mycobacterium sp.]